MLIVFGSLTGSRFASTKPKRRFWRVAPTATTFRGRCAKAWLPAVLRVFEKARRMRRLRARKSRASRRRSRNPIDRT